MIAKQASVSRWRVVRVSAETYDAIERLRREYTDAYAEGRTDVLVPSDQTELVTQAALIARAIELFEDHRRRSNRRRSR